jgi:hypothetical protein
LKKKQHQNGRLHTFCAFRSGHKVIKLFFWAVSWILRFSLVSVHPVSVSCNQSKIRDQSLRAEKFVL